MTAHTLILMLIKRAEQYEALAQMQAPRNGTQVALFPAYLTVAQELRAVARLIKSEIDSDPFNGG